jgi:hypothetical protein
MRRILLACGASLIIYAGAFAFLLDRPLTLGALRARIEANVASGQAIAEPKLVILAGSNGPYSHRCEAIAAIIRRPCVNAGVAVGIGLDYLFARWKPLLRPGDMVYLPLEEAQYVRSGMANALGPDATIMLRHDRSTLRALPAARQLAAVFAGDLRAGVMSLIETLLQERGFNDPRAGIIGTDNAFGDHIGHTADLALANRPALAMARPFHPSAEQITDGFGTTVVVAFLRWAASRGVQAIGGLPTGFEDSPIDETSLRAIRAIYRDEGAAFLELGNHSRYPREAFFDTPDHLNEAAQIAHSIAVGQAMARLSAQFTDRTPMPPR